MDNEANQKIRYIEKGDDVALFVLSEDNLTVKCLKRTSIRYRTLYIPKGVSVISCYAFSYINVKEVVLPEGVKIIKKDAFKNCKQLRRIFIPASVMVIEDEAFLGCEKLEIYCEGEPQEDWLNQEQVKKEYWEDMTDAFNFHRSGGSFDDHYIVKRIEIIYNNYNPEKCPVHTNVSREQFEELLAKKLEEEQRRKNKLKNK